MHYKYLHTNFNRLQSMSNNIFLQNSLTSFTFPVCASFLYGKATKCPLNTKTARSINEYKPVASVGGFVYFNVFVSITPDLIAHMSRNIIFQRYHYSCVFVGHNSDLTYLHLLKSKTGDEAVV